MTSLHAAFTLEHTLVISEVKTQIGYVRHNMSDPTYVGHICHFGLYLKTICGDLVNFCKFCPSHNQK